MANLFDYISWRGDLTFEQSPFTKLDALIFAQLSYIIMDDVIPDNFKETKTFKQFVKEYTSLPDYEERRNIGFLINSTTSDLLLKCAESERFKDIKICGYRNIFSEENVEQFAAVTFLIDKNVVVAYRGTDDTIIGFEEDFQIAFKEQIPAQIHALQYFSDVKDSFPFSDFILVGHSKGGNLAVNTAVRSERKLRKRIASIYNFDGPGFSPDFFKLPEYEEIKSKLYSFYPQLSVVGMLFHHPENYEIVESKNFAIMQHDVLSWNVSGKGFVTREDFTDECKIFYQAFNNWVDKVTMEEKKEFVDSLFSLLKASGYKTNVDIEKNAIQASARIISAYTKMDKNKKDNFKDMFTLLLNTVKSELPIFKFIHG